jgi:hypothetical protein
MYFCSILIAQVSIFFRMKSKKELEELYGNDYVINYLDKDPYCLDRLIQYISQDRSADIVGFA